MSILNPFQLLELNVISAQDLVPVGRSMRTYAVAWVHPDRKLSTRVDTNGHNNPTWNDKFVFRVDEEFLHTDTSAVMIEIYALHWFKDVHVGTVRVLVGNIIPPPIRPFHNHHPQVGMRFVALQVRRPSGRPQGILNIGVALLHSSMRSMPLYSQLSTSAVGYRELMGEEDPFHHHHGSIITQGQGHVLNLCRPELRRTKSDNSSMIGSEIRASEFRGKGKKGSSSTMTGGGSEIASEQRRRKRRKKKIRPKGSSLISSGSSGVWKKEETKQGKASSMINGSEIIVEWKGKIEKSSSIINGNSNSEVDVDPPKKGKNGKVESIVNSNSEVDEAPPKRVVELKPILKTISGAETVTDSPRVKLSPRFNLDHRASQKVTPTRYVKSPFQKFKTPYEYGTPRKSILVGAPFLTESELGPSPSEVAAVMAKQPTEETESSILSKWSVDESVEGLQSKLERWRTELPPVYDRDISSFNSSEPRHARRHTEDGNGLFSCFSNICGLECSIVCGSGSTKPKKSGNSGRHLRSPSAENIKFK
ncbi:hypothetical protein UlMin_010077 [Ulmus minor]